MKKRVSKTNRKVDNLIRQLRNLRINFNQPKRNFSYFTKLRRTNIRGIKQQYDQRFIKYLFGLVHPDYVQENRIEVKQPTFLEIPSASISFKEVYTCKPNASGHFALVWTPNFLNTDQNKKYSHLRLINTDAYVGNTAPVLVEQLNSYSPNISIRGYRLVSALIRINYIGSVVKRSGMIYACADYSSVSVNIADNNAGYTESYRSVDISAVRNGIWGTTTNITEGGSVEALFLPTDPADQTFYPNGSFYGDEIVNNDIRGGDEGARMSYIFAGTGLSSDSDSISIEVFYNFEILPTPASAPIVKAGGNDLDNNQIGVAQTVMSAVNSSKPIKAYIKKKVQNINDVVSKVSTIARVGANVAKIASALL